MDNKYLCSVTDGAAIFNIGRDKLYELIRSNQIPYVQIGSTKKINVPLMREFLDKATKEGRRL